MIVAPVYTDEYGCVSESFEVNSPSSSITLIADLPDIGSIYCSGQYYVTSTHNFFLNHTSSIDIDNLPEKYFPRLYSCSTCRDASDAHLCTLVWDYEKCCGYDFETDQCREVESKPFSFGNVCEKCNVANINDIGGDETDDCSTRSLCPFYSDHSIKRTPAVLAAGAAFTMIVMICYVYRRKNATDAQNQEQDEEESRLTETTSFCSETQ
ncbi:predicted protein [Chaetoceros tenuissimus]|uniref:Uncharacterized protein n=1 Tax=Chaetoceros tenuissimus TaxID=426638 RepID=A0AAD3CE21_9STRA|nr:predicted protein [Chaetoceros tenuissimus]